MPVTNMTMPLEVGTDRRLFVVARNVTESLKVPVTFLNITRLSELRKDAHTSVHTIRQGKMLTLEQQADPDTYADCIHWCLPGLPDTWNEFLYTRIISRSWQFRSLKKVTTPSDWFSYLIFFFLLLFWWFCFSRFSQVLFCYVRFVHRLVGVGGDSFFFYCIGQNMGNFHSYLNCNVTKRKLTIKRKHIIVCKSIHFSFSLE